MTLQAEAVGVFGPQATDMVATTRPTLRACPGCDLFQIVPAMRPKQTARCPRCNTLLRRTSGDPTTTALALSMAALGFLIIGCSTNFMTVSTAGMYHSANMFSGPEGLRSHGLWELAIVVLFTTILAPVLKLCMTIYVLIGLRLQQPPLHLRKVFAWVEHLRPWSMVEVYLLGVAVAYVKLSDLVHIELGVGLYAIAALLVATIAADSALDQQTVWEQIDRSVAPIADLDNPATPVASKAQGAIGCHLCGLVSVPVGPGTCECPRCGSHLHAREAGSIGRTWALLLASR